MSVMMPHKTDAGQLMTKAPKRRVRSAPQRRHEAEIAMVIALGLILASVGVNLLAHRTIVEPHQMLMLFIGAIGFFVIARMMGRPA
jgi:hypothetical protein